MADEKFTQTLGVKVRPSMAKQLEQIAEELFPGVPNAFSVLIRNICTKAIIEHEASKRKTK